MSSISGYYKLEEGLTRAERVEQLVLAEGCANKLEQIYASEPWKRQELAILDIAEAERGRWGKAENLLKI